MLVTFYPTQTLFAKKGDHKSATFRSDKDHSSATFKAKHLIFSSVPGKFKKVEATVTLTDGKISMFEATAHVKSIDTENRKRDRHLKNKDFLSQRKFPLITLKMLSFTKDKMKAELTIRGVKKVVDFDFVHGFAEANEKRKNSTLGMTLSTIINRKDFLVGEKYADKIISEKISVELSFEFDLVKK